MQAFLGRALSPWRQDFIAPIGQVGEPVAGIYKADYRDFNRDTLIRDRETCDATHVDFKRLLLGVGRREEIAAAKDPARDD